MCDPAKESFNLGNPDDQYCKNCDEIHKNWVENCKENCFLYYQDYTKCARPLAASIFNYPVCVTGCAPNELIKTGEYLKDYYDIPSVDKLKEILEKPIYNKIKEFIYNIIIKEI